MAGRNDLWDEDMTHLKERLAHLHATYMTQITALIDETVAHATGKPTSLATMLSYHMSTGGKRLRALLPLALAEVLGHDVDALVPFGAACELLHNATLVHDDLQDGDRVRRGQPTIWVAYGEARAINLGDAMLYYTLLLLGRLDAPVALKYAVQERLIRETLRVIDGQDREFLLQSMQTPGLQDYIDMVEGKTSGLFSLPLAGAALLCGAPDELVNALEIASADLGVVFQIQDDLLDIYGDKGREHRGTDIAEGKISMLVVHALDSADATDAAWLKALLGRERDSVTRDEIEQAIGVLERAGAVERAVEEIDRRIERVMNQPIWASYPNVRVMLEQVSEVFLMGLPPELRAKATSL